LLHPGEDPQALGKPGASERLPAGPVCLVEAALEDGGHTVLLRHLGHLARVAEREVLALDHAGARDHHDLAAAELHALAMGPPAGRTISCAGAVCAGGGTEIPFRCRCSSAALTKPAKSGCAWKGLLWNSGWYWQPMKYG